MLSGHEEGRLSASEIVMQWAAPGLKERLEKIILLDCGGFLLLSSLLCLLHTLLIIVLWTFISHVTHPPFHK